MARPALAWSHQSSAGHNCTAGAIISKALGFPCSRWIPVGTASQIAARGERIAPIFRLGSESLGWDPAALAPPSNATSPSPAAAPSEKPRVLGAPWAVAGSASRARTAVG
jgi:hypothetical protein